jgi:hypothetical protein
MTDVINYPVYRKYHNGLSWFKITGPRAFVEIRKMGSRYLVSHHETKILPERVMLNDLLHDYSAFAVEIEQSEYNAVEILAET